MAVSTELRALVDQMPDPDGRDMYTENIDKDVIEKAIAEIYKGGRENVVGLIELLGMLGSGQDVKPRYALRCLANHILAIKDGRNRPSASPNGGYQLARIGHEMKATSRAELVVL